MKKIAVIGDSHVWGAGAKGYGDQATIYSPLDPMALWFLPFTIPSFVNILRNKVNSKYDSYTKEYCEIHSLPFSLETHSELVRFQLFTGNADASFSVFVNGKHILDRIIHAGCKPKEFVTITIECKGKTEIKLTGDAILFRVEEYGGNFAVVNCGFGGSTVEHYLDKHYLDTVLPLKPDYIVVEPCTINDWLLGTTDEQYYDATLRLLMEANKISKALMVTVSPICGGQISPMKTGNKEYEYYVWRSIDAAKKIGIPIADAHSAMSEKISGLSEKEKFALMYSDNWHPNDLGHRIYAECIFEVLKNYL